MTILTRDWGRTLKLASIPLILAGLAACATPFQADVSRFNTQLPAPTGETFAVVADDPELAGGLEFSQYADYVEAEMTRLGYTLAPAEHASLLVHFEYDVGDGRTRIRSTGFRDPFYSPWYGYRPFYRSRFRSPWAYGFHDPWLGGQDIRSYTVYTSEIDMEIERAATGERLFEGRAQAVSTTDRLQYLIPNLVDAMFTDFPGNSGETVRISIKPEGERSVRRMD